MAQSVSIALDEPKPIHDVDRNPSFHRGCCPYRSMASSPMALDDRIAVEVRRLGPHVLTRTGEIVSGLCNHGTR
jgi:hypothetical protein